MNPCKTLLIVALGVMPGALLAKEPPASTGACSPVFSEVDVKGDFKPVVTCGLPPKFFDSMTAELQKLHKDPAAYRPYVAGTLKNLGVLYRDTQRLKEVGAAEREAKLFNSP